MTGAQAGDVDGSIWFEVAWLADPEGNIASSEIARLGHAFRPLPSPFLSQAQEFAALWFRVRLLRPPPSGGLVVEIANSMPQRYELVVVPPAGGAPRVVSSHGRFLHFRLPENTPREFYIRAEGGRPFKFAPRLVPAEDHAGRSALRGLALGAFYGGLAVIGIVNVFFGLLLREPGHAWYAGSLAFLAGAFLFGFDDVAGPIVPLGQNFRAMIPILLGAWLICGIGLTRSFLHTTIRMPRLDRALRIYMVALAAFLPLLAVGPSPTLRPIFLTALLGTPLLALAVGYVALRRGFAPARLFLLAWTLALAVPALPPLMVLFPAIQTRDVSAWLALAVLAQAVVFTASLMDKVRAVQADNIRLMERREAQRQVVAAEHRLFSEISHELAGPLARLGVALDVCAAGQADAATMERMRADHAALAALRGQMIDLSRLAAAAPQEAPFDLAQAAAAAVSRAAFLAGSGAVALEPLARPFVRGDVRLVERALDNLVRNALAHGRPPVLVRILIESDQAVVMVRDEGAGVPEERIETIFAPFERAALDGAPSGSGLGLSIVRRIVEAHGGDVSARNLPGEGFEVRFALPLSPKRPAASA
ncbi:sensor histidine kinase [Alkalidesulfovibrio alkalitolerans]|uniref:sensor histidine kinase n=1 Tax=Alkalidesulfovibrio alkalitolerans TaxID=293256 RepID=UPI001378AFAA|nr:ATP-binding protein [Alkalidesulfovibrio alkalitolerans]